MKARRIVGAAGGAAIMVGSFLVAVPSANAHGYINGPDSRASLCQQRVNTSCGAVMYEPQSLEGSQGFPQYGPPDGKIASGGTHVGAALDQQTSTRWHKNNVSAGPLTLSWRYTAPHRSRKWHYYITKPGWNPNAPLKRADLEHLQTFNHDGSPAPQNQRHTITIPSDRNGYHVLLGVWDIADTAGAFYQVVDLNVQGNAGPDTQAPTVPQGLHSMDVTTSSVNLMWTASTDNIGVTGYRVYRNGIQVGTVSGTSYTDSGLTANQSYTYTVRAVDAAGNLSGTSTPLSVTTTAPPAQDNQAPSVPQNLHSMGVTASSVNLMWTASTDNIGVTGYRVYRNGIQVGTVSGTSYTDSGLTANQSYTYTVRAFDNAGNLSGASAPLTVTTAASGGGGHSHPDTTAPSVPQGLSSMGTNTNVATFQWAASMDNVGVTEYEIFRDGKKVATRSVTIHTDTMLTPGTEYTYTVRAVDAAGNVSDFSAPLTMRTQGEAPAPTPEPTTSPVTQLIKSVVKLFSRWF